MTEFVPRVEHHLEILPFCLERGKFFFFFGTMDIFVTSNRYASKQIYVCICVHTHYVYSVFWGADYIAKIWSLPQLLA